MLKAMKYRVTWQQRTHAWVIVEAASEEEAIAKVKRGEYDDPDTEPGSNIAGSHRAEKV